MSRSSSIPMAALAVLARMGTLAAAEPAGAPITAVVPALERMQKWNDMQGDTADPFWADDDRLYHFTCDGRGFGTLQRNISFNRLDGPDLESLRGVAVNSMDEYGKAGEASPDGSNWKVCGQECIDGVFYAFVACNKYGKDSKDPLMRQTSYNASLIKSHDRGRTWTRTAKENFDRPMWPGTRFGAPCFIHYGQNGGRIAYDEADQFVYALSNNGFWNGGDDFILARVRRADLPHLRAADWSYHADGAWTPDIARATPVLERPGKLGWTAPTFIPALSRYLLVSWYVTPTLKKWFEPGLVVYDFFEAPHPWGPWTFVSSLDDRFLDQGRHMYGPNLCAKYQVRRGGDVEVQLFTSGCPFEDKPDGLYKNWRIPLTLKTKAPPRSVMVNDNDPAIRYTGAWQALKRPERAYHGGDLHATQKAGDAVEFDFEGTGIEVISEKFDDLGSLEVFIDGRSFGLVSLKQEDFPRLLRIPVFRAEDLPEGRHTLRLVNRSDAWAALDAFRVVGGKPPPALSRDFSTGCQGRLARIPSSRP